MADTNSAAAVPPADQSKRTFAIAAATMGRDLTVALLNELRNLPDHWPRLNKEMQQKVLDRFKDAASETVRTALQMLTSSSFAAVPATLKGVHRSGGIRAALVIEPDALCRHQLFDAEGQKVLVVIADPRTWLERMDEIKVNGNQADLFDRDANYDPEVDQPGYRRDRDPFAPADSWAAMKSALGMDAEKKAEDSTLKQTDTPTEAPKDPVGAEGEPLPSGDDAAVDPHRVSLELLRAQLAEVGVDVSLGTLQAQDDAAILAATLWLEMTARAGAKATRDSRPAWFPLDKGEKK